MCKQNINKSYVCPTIKIFVYVSTESESLLIRTLFIFRSGIQNSATFKFLN